MSMRAPHLIHGLTFDFSYTGTRTDTDSLALTDWIKAALLPVIEEVFEQHDHKDQLRRIDTLKIDLGTVSQHESQTELARRLFAKLSAALSLSLENATVTNLVLEREQVQGKHFLDFLQSGSLDWSVATDARHAHTHLLRHLLASSQAVDVLRKAVEDVQMLTRLVRQFDRDELFQIARLLLESWPRQEREAALDFALRELSRQGGSAAAAERFWRWFLPTSQQDSRHVKQLALPAEDQRMLEARERPLRHADSTDTENMLAELGTDHELIAIIRTAFVPEDILTIQTALHAADFSRLAPHWNRLIIDVPEWIRSEHPRLWKKWLSRFDDAALIDLLSVIQTDCAWLIERLQNLVPHDALHSLIRPALPEWLGLEAGGLSPQRVLEQVLNRTHNQTALLLSAFHEGDSASFREFLVGATAQQSKTQVTRTLPENAVSAQPVADHALTQAAPDESLTSPGNSRTEAAIADTGYRQLEYALRQQDMAQLKQMWLSVVISRRHHVRHIWRQLAKDVRHQIIAQVSRQWSTEQQADWAAILQPAVAPLLEQLQQHLPALLAAQREITSLDTTELMQHTLRFTSQAEVASVTPKHVMKLFLDKAQSCFDNAAPTWIIPESVKSARHLMSALHANLHAALHTAGKKRTAEAPQHASATASEEKPGDVRRQPENERTDTAETIVISGNNAHPTSSSSTAINPSLANFRAWQQQQLDLLSHPMTFAEAQQWLDWWLMHDPQHADQDCSLMLDAIASHCQQVSDAVLFMKLVLQSLQSGSILDLDILVQHTVQQSAQQSVQQDFLSQHAEADSNPHIDDIPEQDAHRPLKQAMQSGKSLRTFVEQSLHEDQDLRQLNSAQLHLLIRAWIQCQQGGEQHSAFLSAVETQALKAASAHTFFQRLLRHLLSEEVIDLEQLILESASGNSNPALRNKAQTREDVQRHDLPNNADGSTLNNRDEMQDEMRPEHANSNSTAAVSARPVEIAFSEQDNTDRLQINACAIAFAKNIAAATIPGLIGNTRFRRWVAQWIRLQAQDDSVIHTLQKMERRCADAQASTWFFAQLLAALGKYLPRELRAAFHECAQLQFGVTASTWVELDEMVAVSSSKDTALSRQLHAEFAQISWKRFQTRASAAASVASLDQHTSPLPASLQQGLPQRLAKAMLQADLTTLQSIWPEITRYHSDLLSQAAKRYLRRADVRERLVARGDVHMLMQLLTTLSPSASRLIDAVLQRSAHYRHLLTAATTEDHFRQRVLQFAFEQVLEQQAVPDISAWIIGILQSLEQQDSSQDQLHQLAHAWYALLRNERVVQGDDAAPVTPLAQALERVLFGEKYLQVALRRWRKNDQEIEAQGEPFESTAQPLQQLLLQEFCEVYPELAGQLLATADTSHIEATSLSATEWQALAHSQLMRHDQQAQMQFWQTFIAALPEVMSETMADVTRIHFGQPLPLFGTTEDESTVEEALQNAYFAGVQVLIAAAGNSGNSTNSDTEQGMSAYACNTDSVTRHSFARSQKPLAPESAISILLLRQVALSEDGKAAMELLAQALLTQSEKSLDGSLQSALAIPQALGRLLGTLPVATLAHLFAHLHPSLAGQLPQLVRRIHEVLLLPLATVPVRFDRAIWRAVYQAAFATGGQPTQREFIRAFVIRLAHVHREPDTETWLRKADTALLSSEATPASTSLTAKEAMTQLLQPLSVAASTTEVDHKKSSTLLEADPPPVFTGASNIHNAGLVIIAPYVQRLFNLLSITRDGQFVSDEAVQRAVHLLQYVVTGQEATPEYQLAFNKLLCGIHGGLPIVRGIHVTEQEKDTIEQMLKGVITHWAAIGSTSISGLRETFLQREGNLYFQDEAWHLKIPQGTFDMLLDRLPWSFSLIKFPWMSAPLHVTWR